jgi:REP element-mobilizing transposase RayT
MPYNPELEQHRAMRLKGYDYSLAGAYFINLVTREKLCLFGEIINGEMRLSQLGNTVQREWLRLERRFPGLELDEFVIMPNHLHGILVNTQQDAPRPGEDVRKDAAPPKRTGATAGSLTAMVKGFKSAVEFRYHNMANNNDPLWQPNDYEQIIHDEDDLDRIRRYIAANPMNWLKDAEYLPRQ